MTIDDGASPMRSLISTGNGFEYRSFHSLEEAKHSDSGWVVLEGDDGGQVYAVFKADSVNRSEAALSQLVKDIDARYWHDDSMARVAYELHHEGDAVAGGMGNGFARADGWIHPQLIDDDLDSSIRRVIAGTAAGL